MSNPSSPTAANTPTAKALVWLRTRPPRQWLLAALLPVLVGAWLPLLRGRSDGPSPAPMPQASSTTTPITAPANAGTFANPTPSLAPSPSSPLAAAPLGEIATQSRSAARCGPRVLGTGAVQDDSVTDHTVGVDFEVVLVATRFALAHY